MRKATDEYVAAKSAFDKWLATAERTQTGKEVINKVRKAEQVLNTKKAAIKEMFISTHPDSKVSAYFLSQLAIETNPKHFLKVYNNLSEKVKRTPYATETKQQIEHILSSYTGSDIPKVFGETPEGKPFDKNLLKNKLTLVVFWASWNKPSTNDFFQSHSLYDELHNKGFEIVGISLDKTKEKWTKSISENKLNWLHVCDFKGAYSANIETFNNNKLPYYILIGPDLKIVDRDVPLSSVEIYFNDFVKKNYTALK
ncbi:TlpA family protein disulfide reductase [Rubrolithibacter danxiaensis]|uniref:TlpA family protein disulfide reductase n=1 Tax=Rubrolithibacter danxiaensis TaxID=3390805 RepID=UPI003BF7F837